MAIEKRDHIIFVGFPPIDVSTPEGEKAMSRLMNATGVTKRNLHFFDPDKKLASIVRESFIPDESQKYGYQIGNSLCIASNSIGAQRQALKNITKVGIEFRAGYQHVDFTDMSEFNIREWLENGKYTPSASQDNANASSEEMDTQSFLDDLLGASGLEDTSVYTEDNDTSTENIPVDSSDGTTANNTVSETSQSDSSNAGHATPASDIFNAIDELSSMASSRNNENTPVGNSVETGEHSSPENITSENNTNTSSGGHHRKEEDTTVYDAELVEDNDDRTPQKSTMPTTTSVFGDNSDVTGFDDLLESISGEKNNSSSYASDDAIENSITPESMGVEDAFSSTPSSGGQGASFSGPSHDFSDRQETDQDDSSRDYSENLRDVEEYRQANNIDSSSFDGDDMDYVQEAIKNRQESKRRQDRQMNDNQRSKVEGLDALASLGQVSDGNTRAEDEARHIEQRVDDISEETHNSDGSVKNYRDYLSDADRKDQLTDEAIRNEFGNLEQYDLGSKDRKSDDLRYVGRGVGRIILCTAGKGGVGKSLVSAGMASALSLARAHEAQQNAGQITPRTWLIESDYNSPQLAVAYKTGGRHLGNIADILVSAKGADNDSLREAIEQNAYRDPDTGVYVLACPPLSIRQKNEDQIPYAIHAAVKYASGNGDDVIIDHGNLTTGGYSSLDKVLAMKTAHRVVIVCNMGCLPETQSALSVLTAREPGSSVKPRPVPSVSVVLNSGHDKQYYFAQENLKPFEVVNVIPPMDALKPENSSTGDTYFTTAPEEVRKKVIDKCGDVLTHLGYPSLGKYFTLVSANIPKKSGKKSMFAKIADKITGG